MVGGIIAAGVIFGIASGQNGFEIGDGAGLFVSNGYGDISPGGYGLATAFIAEVVLTAVFLVVIMGATAKKAAPAIIGGVLGALLQRYVIGDPDDLLATEELAQGDETLR